MIRDWCEDLGVSVARFESPAELTRLVAERGWYSRQAAERPSWVGGVTREQALRAGVEGDRRLVPEAEKLLESVMDEVDAQRTAWVAARAGAYPMVPDALCGHPDSMRRRVTVSDDRAPVRVVVDLTTSGAISARDLERRGVATLALAIAMSNERSVELWTCVGLNRGQGAAFVMCQLPSAPLDLATACHALTSPSFARGVGYGYLEGAENAGGYWPWNLPPFSYDGADPRFAKKVRQALGLAPDDVFIPPAHAYDPVYRDPVGFVRRALAEHNKREE